VKRCWKNLKFNKVPKKLKDLIIKLFQKIWDATGAFIEKFKALIEKAYKAAGNTELPSFDKITEKLDNLYDSAEGINFVIAICLMFFGGAVNSDGEFTI
jgi:hypothetical protein